METQHNPFTQRGAIRDPRFFAGRWGELSLLFGALEQRLPVAVVGVAGVGKSSLLQHVAQSAAVNLERLDLIAISLDLAGAATSSAAEVYRLIIRALAQPGETPAALLRALASTPAPVLVCLDNADQALSTAWGTDMLDSLARLARGGHMLLACAFGAEPPALGERFALVRLGAFAQAEVRLFTEAYLEGTGVAFGPRNLQQLYQLSLGHPAYMQRAAYHLFQAARQPGYPWAKAYLDEARDMPIPGSPLPPQVFAATAAAGEAAFTLDTGEGQSQAPPAPAAMEIEAPPTWVVAALVGLVILVIVLALR